MSAQTAAGERAAAVELAQALWAQLPAPALWRGGAVPVTLESVTDALVEPLGRLLRQVERDALWQVILYLSLELERKSRPGEASSPPLTPETPE